MSSELSVTARKKIEKIDVPNNFKDDVVRYLGIDDEIKKKQDEIKELRAKKKSFESNILGYLDQLGETTIVTPSGKLYKNKYQSKSQVNAETVLSIVGKEIKDKDVLDKIQKHINENRQVTVRTSLKRTSCKK